MASIIETARQMQAYSEVCKARNQEREPFIHSTEGKLPILVVVANYDRECETYSVPYDQRLLTMSADEILYVAGPAVTENSAVINATQYSYVITR